MLLSSYRLFNRTLQQRWFSSLRAIHTATAGQQQNPKQAAGEEVSNEPVKFFGSQAASWRAKDSRSGGADDVLWYQPYVVSLSVAVFMIYFCILREENDIDRKLEGNLFDQVSGLEEAQLAVNYKYNKENHLDNTAVVQRLLELGVDVKQLDAQL